MMYKPISPCGEHCERRGLESCLECEPWKEYKAKMLEYYEAEHRDKSVLRSAIEQKTRHLQKIKRQQGSTSFHVK